MKPKINEVWLTSSGGVAVITRVFPFGGCYADIEWVQEQISRNGKSKYIYIGNIFINMFYNDVPDPRFKKNPHNLYKKIGNL